MYVYSMKIEKRIGQPVQHTIQEYTVNLQNRHIYQADGLNFRRDIEKKIQQPRSTEGKVRRTHLIILVIYVLLVFFASKKQQTIPHGHKCLEVQVQIPKLLTEIQTSNTLDRSQGVLPRLGDRVIVLRRVFYPGNEHD